MPVTAVDNGSNDESSRPQIASPPQLPQDVEELIESALRHESKQGTHAENRIEDNDDPSQKWYRSLNSIERENLDTGIQSIISGAMLILETQLKETNVAKVQSSRSRKLDRNSMPQQQISKPQQQNSRKKNVKKATNRTRNHHNQKNSKASNNSSKNNYNNNNNNNNHNNINHDIRNIDNKNAGSRNAGVTTGSVEHRGGISIDFCGGRPRNWPSPEPDYRRSGLVPMQGAAYVHNTYGPSIYHHPSTRQVPYSPLHINHPEGVVPSGSISAYPLPSTSGSISIGAGGVYGHRHPGPPTTNHHHFNKIFYNERGHHTYFEAARRRSRSGSPRGISRRGEYDDRTRHRSRSDSRTGGYGSRREQDSHSIRSQSPVYYREARDRDRDWQRDSRSNVRNRSNSRSRSRSRSHSRGSSRSKEIVKRSNRKRNAVSTDDRADPGHRSYRRHDPDEDDDDFESRPLYSRPLYREGSDDNRTHQEKIKKESKPTRRSPRKMDKLKSTVDGDKPVEGTMMSVDDISLSEEQNLSIRRADRRRELRNDNSKRNVSPADSDEQRRRSSLSRKKHNLDHSSSSSEDYSDPTSRSVRRKHRRVRSGKHKRTSRWPNVSEASVSKDNGRSPTRNQKNREKESISSNGPGKKHFDNQAKGNA